MTQEQQHAIDDRLPAAFGRRPTESLVETARRSRFQHKGRKARAATVVIECNAKGLAAWERLARADRILRGVGP
jgi:hypothetical protein